MKLPPVRHQSLCTSEVNIHYASLPSEGQPLILLHGIGMDWRVWQAMSRRLWPDFHLLMVDLRGHGQSDKPEHGYSLAEYAADVEDLIDRLQLQRVALVGSSLGGVVAACVESPVDVVSHRILVDPPLTGGPVREPERFREILRLKSAPGEELARYLQDSDPGVGRVLAGTMAQMWREAADGVIVDMLDRARDYFAVDSALQADDSPTLLLQADPALGGVLTAEDAVRALHLLPCGSLAKVEGAGHAIHAHRPAIFAQLLRDFLSGSRPWTQENEGKPAP